MQFLKSLADKGKRVTTSLKDKVSQLSSRIYDYTKNTRLANTINKYYNVIKSVPNATKNFVTNLADKLLFISRPQTTTEKKLSLAQNKSKTPHNITKGPEKPLTIKEDENLFNLEIKDNVIMSHINIPIEKYEGRDITEIQDELADDIYRIIRGMLIHGKISLGFYVQLEAQCEFYKPKDDTYEVKRRTSNTFKRNIVYVGSINDLSRVITLCVLELSTDILQTDTSSSGFRFNNFVEMVVTLYYFKKPSDIIEISEEPVKQGFKYRPLPLWIRYSKSISNIKNTDDLCLIWAILRSLYPDKDRHHNKITKELREMYKSYDWCGLDDPSQISEEKLCKFEDKYNFKIVIFKIKDKPKVKILHLRHFEDEDSRTKIYLGFYIDHYFVIRNIEGFIRCLYNQKTKHTGRLFICPYCYKHSTKKTTHIKHINRCKGNPPSYKFPEMDYIYFNRIYSTLRYPAVVYADFEATNVNVNENGIVTKQIPNSFCIFCPEFEILEVRYSPNAEELFEQFWNILYDIYKKLKLRYKENKQLQENIEIRKDAKCAFCNSSESIVKHHDHFTGKFICYACSSCNKKIRKPYFVRVFFHNLKGYDSHFIIKYALKYLKDWTSITPLGKSKEKLFAIKIPINKKKNAGFYFLDSYCHLPFSLSQLVYDYVTDYRFKKFLPLNGNYKHKEAYPYEWFDDYSKFDEKEFPPKEAFYNRLNNKEIGYDEYHEIKLMYKLHCKTFKDYHDIYLRGDTVLLAEVFEKYRELSMESYGIDPAWYVSGPSFFYNAMLKMTGAKLPLIKDEEVYRLIKSNIRGGICGVGEISEATASSDSSIISLDCVNLYGRAMMDSLPVKILEYSRDTKKLGDSLEKFLSKVPNDIGYIFEVDIESPESLHDLHKAYPLFPEKIDGKLMQTLNPKKHYVVLDTYLKVGLDQAYKVTKVHSYLKFKKAPIMKEYIEFNTNKRRQADALKEKSKVQYYKNANNMVYGKNIENPEKYTNYVIAKGEEALKIYSEAKWKDCIVIDEEEKIMLFDIKKEEIKLDKPILIGFCILDISKAIMANHFYNLRKHLPFKLLYTDTDSFKIYCDYSDKEAYRVLKSLEFIETPESKVKKVPGKLAFEGFHTYFKAIASKHYIADNKEKCKGVPSHCTTVEPQPVRFYHSIKSKNHEIFVVENLKILSYKDNKKIKKGNENYPFGYKGQQWQDTDTTMKKEGS